MSIIPGELRWQKIQAQEKDTLAIIRRDFSTSRMNTTKWREAVECLEGLHLTQRIKFVDVPDTIFEVSCLRHVTRDWFDCAPLGPFKSVSIEWLEIDLIENMERASAELERRLQAVRVPYQREGDMIRIIGHVRNSAAP